jgi:hypothetical protein
VAKPTNAIKGFIRLTTMQGEELLVGIPNISAVRPTGENSSVLLINSPYFYSQGSHTLPVKEDFEEIVRRIGEAQ